MYAVIAADGRQYKVEEGQIVQIDLRDDAKDGDTITFDQILCLSGNGSVKIGKPTVAGATVTAEVQQSELKGEKIYIQKFRRRKNYRRRTGHRQKYTKVKITGISGL
jgi:large subunit ribosomal protein L21